MGVTKLIERAVPSLDKRAANVGSERWGITDQDLSPYLSTVGRNLTS